MTIGPYTITALETGRFALDGGAMFGIVPWVFWSASNPPDNRQRITLAARCLLVRGNGRTILVDNGNGDKWGAKLRDIYRLDMSRFSLSTSLAAAGVTPNDITDVILTHLHFDHAGGSTILVDGKPVPAFPRAKYYVQKDHWDWSRQPTDRDRASFMKDDYLPLHEQGMLEYIDGEGELFPGIRLVVTNGHTTAQQLPLITDGVQSLLFCCDLIPTASHVPYPYIMGYDLRPLVTLDEKKRILPRAYEERWTLFLEHDPDVHGVTLKSTDKGFAVDRRLTTV
ncbi:MAG: MBL fold metallo-hydrolase [Ignavibacteria bacterium GWA2_55_11]|nr:MAG: MBL fold metallo-hydrolase [Ignavibacteria bacterium GWA2_55_11]OGU44043.1 MAG: MBL fold metallo-hydrolase [Ignavibacteria bacterium GWC2_56_12]OGU68344.1 MAG: MBL fold metallo-hydrolase [Ignavibacteria bacterium RIFCSPHIGHO2_02_FULL_56_12]OGU71316.1 MAG: MBL fold metallo-hydrolase [Ignavibacteria bacterium RIFCSPLOWO2_12_FULL_56_21]OGU75583.1 MAG: MBL fold metallo-hydrolase [Ignavibacteria bacterium RIFCSPLOWO2_02_FULL_55_14]HAV22608.1 MBL fold metallo-hydrolase [Bacteroidota bacteriu